MVRPCPEVDDQVLVGEASVIGDGGGGERARGLRAGRRVVGVEFKLSLDQLTWGCTVVAMAGVGKQRLFDAFASVGKALSNGRRAELVDVLVQGERSVEELAGQIGQSTANTSQHLQVLARAGLVVSRRDGNRVRYRMAGPEIEALWDQVRVVTEAHVAGLDRLAEEYLGDRSALEQVSRAELAQRLADGVEVWDVRPRAEFEAGHVLGAVSVPPEEVEQRLAELPEGVEVVAYCRGPYCVFADDAVRALAAIGRRARRLEDGFPQWRRAGLPVEVGSGRGAA
jgi:rhodanese-related sulfurtransferase/DNA-binding transcriptional ArsR family regulator